MLLLQNELVEQSLLHVYKTVFVSETSTVKEMFEELSQTIKHIFPTKNWVQLFAVYKPASDTYAADAFKLDEVNLLVMLASFCWNVKEWNKLYEACAIPLELIKTNITQLHNFNQMRSFGYLKKYCYQTANITISECLNFILEDHEDCLKVLCMIHTELMYAYQPQTYIELYPFNLDPPSEQELADEKLCQPYDPENFKVELQSAHDPRVSKSCLRTKRNKPPVVSLVFNHRPKREQIVKQLKPIEKSSRRKQLSWAEEQLQTVFLI